MKKVHFAPVNATFWTPPVPSSPAASSSALSVSSNQSPAVVYPRLPYELDASPLPSPPFEEMNIHFLLAFSPYGRPALQYDVSWLPSLLLEDQITTESLSEPATEPPLSRLSIIHPNLPRPIVVTATSRRLPFITVSDVFHAVYEYLRASILPEDYKGLPSMDVVKEVDMAYYRRCRECGDGEAHERAQGIRLVDLLMSKNRFLGLSGTFQGPDVWELNVA